jgi:hypothetical protein
VQAGMAQLLAHDVDRDVFHRQLGSTGVAQAMGWTRFSLLVLCASRSKRVRTELACKECPQLDRPTQKQGSFNSPIAGWGRSLCGALYTVFLLLFYNAVAFRWLFVRLLNCERRTRHKILKAASAFFARELDPRLPR